jgi:hypothetical protein
VKKSLETKIAALIAKCWTDQEFKQRFVREPKAVIAEILLDLPPGAELVVLEDSSERRHLVLPPPPPEGFSTEDLGAAARNFLEPAAALYCIEELPAAALYCASPDKPAELSALYCAAPKRAAELAALYCEPPENVEEVAALYCLASDKAAKFAAPHRFPPEESDDLAAPYCRQSDADKGEGGEANPSSDKAPGDK